MEYVLSLIRMLRGDFNTDRDLKSFRGKMPEEGLRQARLSLRWSYDLYQIIRLGDGYYIFLRMEFPLMSGQQVIPACVCCESRRLDLARQRKLLQLEACFLGVSVWPCWLHYGAAIITTRNFGNQNIWQGGQAASSHSALPLRINSRFFP